MMQVQMSQPLTQASVALLLGVSSVSASAALVTQWDYSTNSTFSNPTWSTGGGETNETSSELSWGSGTYCSGTAFFGMCLGGTFIDPDFQDPKNDTGNNRSALTIGSGPDDTLTGGGPATGTVDTVLDGSFDAGDFAIGTNITHWNNPIFASYSLLESAILTDTLTLTPVMTEDGAVIGGPDVEAPTVTFSFDFLETINSGTCAGGEPGPCPDLFGFDEMPLLDLSFDYLDITYFVSVLMTDPLGQASPINPLHAEECDALGLNPGCQGFRTVEEAVTTAQFAFSVSADPLFDPEPVPAPAPLALMGLGFLAMGFSRRWVKITR